MDAFCILAAGRGERLRKVMKLHKCLAPIHNQAVISHIINKAPGDTEIVIALGHQGDLVKEYCEAAHPDRKFVFVKVENFDGPGSGPGLSLSCCKAHLQRPFYLFCGDCIIEETLPDLSTNWMGVFPVDDSTHWSTAQVYDGKVVGFKNKSSNGYDYAFIGVAGIKDYETFWGQLKHTDKEFEMVSAFYDPLAYDEILATHFTWHDTGTPENYNKSKAILGPKSLGMAKEINEITYRVGDRCVKVFGELEIVDGRIKRAELLHGLIPPLVYRGQYVYAYEWIDGVTMYEKVLSNDVDSRTILQNFLGWCQTHLWIPSTGSIIEECKKFYQEKTYHRLRCYFEKKNISHDITHTINNRVCEPIEILLGNIDWTDLHYGKKAVFHGDLQFENVIVHQHMGKDQFHLIDWRDSFADLKSFGDLYYDLAKLNSGLMMCYHKIKQGYYNVNCNDDRVTYWFDLPEELNQLRLVYENWLLKQGHDLYKVRVLTALIYLNMAPLHIEGFDELLFYHSKYLLAGI